MEDVGGLKADARPRGAKTDFASACGLTGGSGTPGALIQSGYRQAGVGAAAERALPQNRSPKGLKPGQMDAPIKSGFVLLSALNGESLEDMERVNRPVNHRLVPEATRPLQ